MDDALLMLRLRSVSLLGFQVWGLGGTNDKVAKTETPKTTMLFGQ